MAESRESPKKEIAGLSGEDSLACDTAENRFLPLVTVPGHHPESHVNDWHLPRRSFLILVGLSPALALESGAQSPRFAGSATTALFFRKL